MAEVKKAETSTKGEPSKEEASKPEEKVMNSDIREMIEDGISNDDGLVDSSEDKDEEISEPLSDSPADESEDNDDDNEPLDDSTDDEDISDDDGDESEEVSDELESLLDVEDEVDKPKKSGTDKRIDKLTKRLYDLEQENAALKKQPEKPKPESIEKPKYTKEQLATALRKARDEGDTDLEIQIMEHISDSKAIEVENKYKAKEEQLKEAQRKAQVEWTTIVNMNEHLADQEVEIYPNSNKELNIGDGTSLLYRLAQELYVNHGYKEKENGMSLAVADALKRILLKKKNSSKSRKTSKEKKLETKVKKLKRKTSSPSGSKTIKSDSTKKSSGLKGNTDKVKDAISERRQQNAWKHI